MVLGYFGESGCVSIKIGLDCEILRCVRICRIELDETGLIEKCTKNSYSTYATFPLTTDERPRSKIHKVHTTYLTFSTPGQHLDRLSQR